MIRYFLNRPVAILVLFAALVVLGCVLIFKVPVSLLPAIDVPRMAVKVSYPNASAHQVEDLVLRPIRDELATINHLYNIHSEATNHQGMVYLDFDYGSNMSLAYIEVNEKVDRLSGRFPENLSRPQVVRVNTSDIPVLRVQVTPTENISYEEASELTVKVLKRRLEQIPGVSVVDVNGQTGSKVVLEPYPRIMSAYGVTADGIVNAIRSSNSELGGLNLKDGQYQYFIRLENNIKDIDALKTINVETIKGDLVPLNSVASISLQPADPVGFHLFNGKKGLVITVQGQAQSRMNDLVPLIKEAVEEFKQRYPQVNFDISQDQSFILNAGTDNLTQDVLIGGIMTIALLFLFLGNWASPLLMSISIPVSLIITFIFFYAFSLSFNIISLSGLALGVGMLIDNSIVVIGHITRKRILGLPLLESCVQGTNEMAVPVTSQVLTTIVVYAPLVLLNGLSGSLVADQSIALTISLLVSLLVAFVLTPVLFNKLLRAGPEKLKEDTRFYKWVSLGYHSMITYILGHRKVFFLLTLSMVPLGFVLAFFVPFDSLPYIEKKEGLIKISWNEPIDISENLRRSTILIKGIGQAAKLTEAEVGATQFLFQQDNGSIYETQIYYACTSEQDRARVDEILRSHLKVYPQSTVQMIDAPNAFTQLFVNEQPFVLAKFKPLNSQVTEEDYNALMGWIDQNKMHTAADISTHRQPAISAHLDLNRMNIYSISRQAVDRQLSLLFGNETAGAINGTGGERQILINNGPGWLEQQLSSKIRNDDGIEYPLSAFVTFDEIDQFSYVTADKDGRYKAVILPEQPGLCGIIENLRSEAVKRGFSVSFTGRYFENRELMLQMGLIFIVVLVLLYLVLALQFESFIQPVVVMLTIPLGITGAVTILLLSGGSFNVMSAIGFVVVLGLIVDDPLLKIETLNRLKKEYSAAGLKMDEQLLYNMLHEAGEICLKPLLMVSLTTSVALLPVLFIGGIGNELQRPMALVIIGGLTIGTFFTTWFIPLAYWYMQKWTKKI